MIHLGDLISLIFYGCWGISNRSPTGNINRGIIVVSPWLICLMKWCYMVLLSLLQSLRLTSLPDSTTRSISYRVEEYNLSRLCYLSIRGSLFYVSWVPNLCVGCLGCWSFCVTILILGYWAEFIIDVVVIGIHLRLMLTITV